MTGNTERHENTRLNKNETYDDYIDANRDESKYGPYNGVSSTRTQPNCDRVTFFKKNKLFMLVILLGTLFVGVLSGGLLNRFLSQQCGSSGKNLNPKQDNWKFR